MDNKTGMREQAEHIKTLSSAAFIEEYIVVLLQVIFATIICKCLSA